MSSPSNSTVAGPKRQLGLFDATCIIIGIVIGSGIYKTTPIIAGSVGNANWLILVWLLGGAIALMGAMCYAELSTAYPDEGGDYVYLSRAFGRNAGFLFAWAEYWIVRPGNVGMMAFVFATFADGLLRTPTSVVAGLRAQVTYAAGAVIVLTILNVLGVRTGKTTQNILATIKVLGLVAIIIVGLFWTPPVSAEVANGAAPPSTNFRLAMILVLFTYGGWNEISYVAAEVRNPERNLMRSLLFGILAITVLYVLVNLAFLRSLGLQEMASSQQVAATLFQKPFGDWGAKAMNLLVCISALGAINGILFTGARIYFAVGSDNSLVSWLGKWSGQMDSPVRALVLQGLISVALIISFGSYEGSFERLAYFTTPVYWFFAFMVGISLMVLRWRDSDRPRPHKVWFYPWTPALFCLTCAVLCESGFTYALSQQPREAAWSVGLMLVGVIIATVFGRDQRP